MKKLMMAAAIACAAVAAQAETTTYTWSGSNFKDGSGNYVSSGTYMYLFGNGGGMCEVDASVIFNAIVDMGFDDFVTELQSATEIGDLGWRGDTVGDNGAFSTSFQSDKDDPLASDQAMWFLLAANDKAYFSPSATVGSTTDLAFGDLSESSSTVYNVADGWQGAGWYTTSSVPEPTSGLLLLLGMAGLALKRKIA